MQNRIRALVRSIAIVSGLICLGSPSSTVSAENQKGSEPVQESDSMEDNWEIADSLNLPSPAEAARRSRFFTLAAIPTVVLTLPGLVVGPSTGFFYGDRPARAWTGIAIRFAATVGIAGSFFATGIDFDPHDNETGPWVLLGASTAVLTGSVVYDLVTVKQSVENNNRRRLQRAIAMFPVCNPGSKTVGLRIAVIL